jgi:hypothetical protein
MDKEKGETLTRREYRLVLALAVGLMLAGQVFLFFLYVNFADCVCYQACLENYESRCWNQTALSNLTQTVVMEEQIRIGADDSFHDLTLDEVETSGVSDLYEDHGGEHL